MPSSGLHMSILTLTCKSFQRKLVFLKGLCELGLRGAILVGAMGVPAVSCICICSVVLTCVLWAEQIDPFYRWSSRGSEGCCHSQAFTLVKLAHLDGRAKMLQPWPSSQFPGDYRVSPPTVSGPLSVVQFVRFWGDILVGKVLAVQA